MKKLVSIALVLILALSMCISVSATEVSDGTVLVKTWENNAGETVTGIITKGDSTLVARTNPQKGNEARGFITNAPDIPSVITFSDDTEIDPQKEVSDVFYMQIYNSNDQVVSKYKITLTGKVTIFSKKITDVSISRVSGTTCSTDYDIDGNTAYVIITHPTEGYLDATFTLDSDGNFSVT